jgi:hypothetical protein
MLGTLELAQVQHLEVEEAEALSVDPVPALAGDFLTVAGRRSGRALVQGVLTGPSAAGDLASLREAFRGATPVPFTADIAAATGLDQVVLEAVAAVELAGKPERVEYALVLREHVPPPPVEQEAAEQLPGAVDEAAGGEAAEASQARAEQVAGQRGRLDVRVEGPAAVDYSAIVVWVEGEGPDGTPVSVWSSEQVDGVYTFPDVAAGSYQVRAELR